MALEYFFDSWTIDTVIELIADGTFFSDFNWVEDSLMITIEDTDRLGGFEREAYALHADKRIVKSIVYEGMKQWVERNSHLAWYK